MNRLLLFFALSCFCFIKVFSQSLTGTKVIGVDYATINAAIQDLNTKGVGTGGVTFNIPAGTSYSENLDIIAINVGGATSSAERPVLFQKSGDGANPVVKRASSTSAGGEFVISVQGPDYITFDGIDVATDAASGTEWGYYLRNASATNPVRNITIKNCKVILNPSNSTNTSAAIYGIYYQDGTIPNTDAFGSDITISNVVVESCTTGIYINGNSTTPVRNIVIENCTIGGAGADNITNLGNTGVNGAIGIFVINGYKATVRNNIVRNITTTIAQNGWGIGFQVFGNNYIYGNQVYNVKSTLAGTGVIGFRLYPYLSTSAQQTSGVDASTKIYSYNNIIHSLSNSISGSTSNIVGIACDGPASAPSNSINLFYNNISYDASTTNSTRLIAITQSGITNIKNNILSYNSISGTGAKYLILYNGGIGSTLNSDNNVMYVANNTGTNYFGYYKGLTTVGRSTFADWKASATGLDANSYNNNPMFISSTELRSSLGSYKTAIPITEASDGIAITTDIAGTTRRDVPSVGAYESPTVLSVNLLSFSGKATFNTVALSWVTALEQNVNHFEVQSLINGNWQTVSLVVAKGSAGSYSASHNAEGSLVYYRLKTVDEDGSYSFSSSIEVKLYGLVTGTLSVYPNPSNGAKVCLSSASLSYPSNYKIVNAAGEVVKAGMLTTAGQTLDCSQLTSGVYFIIVLGGPSIAKAQLLVTN